MPSQTTTANKPMDSIEDDDMSYESVDTESDDEELNIGNETLQQTLTRLREKKRKEEEEEQKKVKENQLNQFGHSDGEKRTLKRKAEVIDDFIRNFLRQHGLSKTLDLFQEEWYEYTQRRRQTTDFEIPLAPDVYIHNQELEEKVKILEEELEQAKQVAQKAIDRWEKLKKERDYHKMHHQRTTVEKKELMKDLKRLRNHCEKYEPTLLELRRKYEAAMKEKMLMRLDRDKQQAQLKALKLQMSEDGGSPEKKSKKTKKSTANMDESNLSRKESLLPPDDRLNPYINRSFPPAKADEFSLADSFPGHTMAISYLALHPKKPIVATVSDDTTWKMWALPSGKVLMSGDGHTDWLSCCDFHPSCTHLATSSGDGTVKIWDFYHSRCAATLIGHTQAVWACAFHDTGDFLASCSLDQTAKLWDIQVNKCKTTFRGQHKDSINHVAWQPFSNVLCTCSGDHSVSLWDARSAKCIETFYGHDAAVNHCSFSLRGDRLMSCDAEGRVFLWDIRMVNEITNINAGPHAANHCSFDSSSDVIAISSNDGKIKMFTGVESNNISEPLELSGHEDAVQAAVFDRDGKFLVSGGSDSMLRLFQ